MQHVTEMNGEQDGGLVSVILPVDRDHAFLDPAVHSILSQTYRNFELLLVANGCSDDDWRAFRRFSDSRVRFARTNLRHLPFALNLGIHIAKGDLIARMDSDDLSHPQRLDRQVQRFTREAELTVLGTRYELINSDGVNIGDGPPLPCTNERIRRRLPYRCPLAHPTIMFRKSAIERVGGYMYGSPSEDYDLWLRLSRDKAVVFGAIAEPLLSYRVHGAQETALGKRGKIFAFDFALKIREFIVTGRPSLLAGAMYSTVILLGSPILHALRASRI